MMTLGVVGHTYEIAAHRDVLRGCRDIQLVHQADCAAILEQKIDGLVLLQVEDKSHWIGVALASGLHVMATHPVQMPSHSKVCVLSLGRHTHFCSALAARQGIAHYSLELSFDSALFNPIEREIVCSQVALDVCDLLLSTWGPVDVLYSRMRNFFHLGRIEDVSAALLRMRNGVEGSVALLDCPGVAPVLHIREYAQDEIVNTSWPWVWKADDLAAYYRNFVAYIQGNAQPLLSLDQATESHRLLEWMRTSARQDAILNRKQVKQNVL